jgi:hypothetical protein
MKSSLQYLALFTILSLAAASPAADTNASRQ